MQKSANMYYKPFFVSLMDFSGSTVIFCSLFTFVHVYKQCHLLCVVVVVYVCFRSCLQIMLRALVLLYWPLMFKTLYICICIFRHLSIPANSVKPESVFQIICLYETTIFNQYGYISVMLVAYPVSSCNYIPTFIVFQPIKRQLTSTNIISNIPYHDCHTWFHIQPVYQSYLGFLYSLHK